MTFKTDQEKFWAGSFGDQYILRNSSREYFASNLSFFSKVLEHCGKPKSIIEFGANIGMNLKALKLLYPQVNMFGVEINQMACEKLKKFLSPEKVYQGSLLDYSSDEKYDLALIKGVLIHLDPEVLPKAYQIIYRSSRQFILLCEYYSPKPQEVLYRGHENRLYKRDFAGEMMDAFPDLKLVDYGFCYHKDPNFPQDDINWFMLRK